MTGTSSTSVVSDCGGQRDSSMRFRYLYEVHERLQLNQTTWQADTQVLNVNEHESYALPGCW